MARRRVSTQFGPVPFDRQGHIGTIVIQDDFINFKASADLVDATGIVLVSDVPWWGNEIAGAAVSNIAKTAAIATHPGVIQLKVGATSPATGDAATIQLGADAAAVQESFLLDENGVYVAFVVKIPDVDGQKVECGLIGQTPEVPNASAVDVVSFVWDPADAANVGDAFWFAQVNSAGTDVEVVSTLAYVQDDWVLLEIGADDTSASFRITTEDGSEVMNPVVAAMPLVGMRPVISVSNVGAAEETLYIDCFTLRYMRQDRLPAGWLGA